MMGVIETWRCPRRCGYFREWHESWEYLSTPLTHPLYGRITSGDLVYHDILNHDCRAYWLAIRRLKERRWAQLAA